MSTPNFALYVSSVEGHLVTRYGGGARGAPSYIGARRVAGDPTRIEWDTELVVALTVDELRRYSREYERAVHTKAVVKRSRADYLAQLAREDDAQRPAKAAAPEPAVTPHAEPAPPVTPTAVTAALALPPAVAQPTKETP